MFRRNPNIPSTLTDNPPALEGTKINHSYAKHIHATHSARSVFIEAECSEKVRRALRAKLRTQSICFKHGDKVFTRQMIQTARGAQGLSQEKTGKSRLLATVVSTFELQHAQL